ncbi:MAG: phosphopantetheine-binding protein, partial [Gammaproteobacteria bacterium]|nr:phosphopantetheine-binding protein [Gammaproteobacteria bacterium]
MPGSDTGVVQSSPTADDTVGRLLDIVQQLAVELHPGRTPAAQVKLDSTLDRDLGFDSLSRVEMLLRIERAF